MAPSAADRLAGQVSEPVTLVTARLKTGVLTPDALGLASTASADRLVPGTPIRLADFVGAALAGLSNDSSRTYRSYLSFLADGWPAAAPRRTRSIPGSATAGSTRSCPPTSRPPSSTSRPAPGCTPTR